MRSVKHEKVQLHQSLQGQSCHSMNNFVAKLEAKRLLLIWATCRHSAWYVILCSLTSPLLTLWWLTTLHGVRRQHRTHQQQIQLTMNITIPSKLLYQSFPTRLDQQLLPCPQPHGTQHPTLWGPHRIPSPAAANGVAAPAVRRSQILLGAVVHLLRAGISWLL